MEINYKAIGERIRHAREKERLTQEKLSELCSISAAHMGHIERGSRKPSLEAMIRISSALHISMDYLLAESYSPDDTLLSNMPC